MSHKANDAWLEAAQENFQEALDNSDYSLAAAVANDVDDAGFEKEAKKMRQSINSQAANNS